MTTLPPQLDYAPKPAITRRRWLRRTVIAVIILAAAPILWHWAGVLIHLAHIRRLYDQCAAYSAGPHKIVFSDIAEDATSGYVILPNCWVELNLEVPHTQIITQGTVFLHEMRTAGGQRRLVGVDLVRDQFRGNTFTTRVFSPASMLRMPTQISSNSPGPLFFSYTTRAYAGQIDSADPSHFTISLTIDGQSRTLDGWLKDDDSVAIEERHGSGNP